MGPNWRKDFDLWCLEQEAEWTTIGPKSKPLPMKSYTDVVRRHEPPSHKSVFQRLNYPANYHEAFLPPSRGAAKKIHPKLHPQADRFHRPSKNSRRVLRWVPKCAPSISADEKAGDKAKHSLAPNSNSESHLPPSHPNLAHVPSGPSSFPGLTPDSHRDPAQCSRCLNPGHSSRDCHN